MIDQPALPMEWTDSNVYDLTGRLAARADLNTLLNGDDLVEAKRAELRRIADHLQTRRRPVETVDPGGLL